MEVLFGSIVFLVALLVGIFVGKKLYSQPALITLEKLRDLEGAKIALETKLKDATDQVADLKIDVQKHLSRTIELEKINSSFLSDKKHLEELVENNKIELVNIQKQMTGQFENLANKVLEENSKKLRETSESNLKALLNPLSENIKGFTKTVTDTYSAESRERSSLQGEIKRIVETSNKMTLETNNLSKALRGDVKAQGNWGEVILETVLESSGLRQGHEYFLQGEKLDLKDASGRRQLPDVIVKLPKGRHLIVDSKVSLTNYDRYICDEDQETRALELKAFLESITSHIHGLAGKRYQDQEKLVTPDFVMMFFPIEGAFSLALQTNPQLLKFAWDRSIILVSPTTLLATLRTVESTWKNERQQQNHLEIARQAGALYDKFVGFAEDINTIGMRIKGAHDSYEDALAKLSSGKGNLVARVTNLKKLGAKTSKSLPASLELESDSEENHEEAEVTSE